MGRGEIAHPTCLTMPTVTAGSQCISEMGMESFAPLKEQILVVQHGVLSPMHPCWHHLTTEDCNSQNLFYSNKNRIMK